MKFRNLLPLLLFGWCTAALADDAADSAKALQYLRAWSFKDYPSMYSASTPETQKLASQPDFAAAAATLTPPTGDPKIVSTSPSASGNTLYFESAGTPPMRGSVIIRSGAVEHPELLAALRKAQAASAPAPATATSDARTIDGETADSILQKMTAASEKADTLRMSVAVKGSMMGQTINDTGTLLYKKPGKFRMQLATFTMNADGSRSILYLPSANMYMDVASLGSFELSPGIGSSAAEMKSKYDVRLSAKKDVNGQPAFELLMKPPQSGLGGLAGSGNMKLLVNATTWLPRRAEMSGMTLDYSNVQVNAPGITDENFVFTPPASAQELSLGSLMGGMQ